MLSQGIPKMPKEKWLPIYIYKNMDGEIVGTESCVYFAMDNLRL